MSGAERLLELPPYGAGREEKRRLLTDILTELTERHRAGCAPYRNMLSALGYDPKAVAGPEDLPFLPVGLFKAMELYSVPEAEIVRTVASSGTSGQAASKILLDARTAALQQRALAAIVSDFIGPERLPMLVIDRPSVLRDRRSFTARGAGILGFSVFGRGRVFALDEEMRPDLPAIEGFLERYGGGPFLLFGFTFLVWEAFYRALSQSGKKLDLSGGILIHGGGWKALSDRAVPPGTFRERLGEWSGLRRVHDYYGMAEQTGSVFMACEHGNLHASCFSEVFVRRPSDFSLCGRGEAGILQVLSVLPQSYPGHSLLTEDRGVLRGEDDCPCGRKGKYIEVLGRLEAAELRGCSDTYAAEHG